MLQSTISMNNSKLLKITLVKTLISILITITILSLFPDIPLTKALTPSQRRNLWIFLIFGISSSLVGIGSLIAIRIGKRHLLGLPEEGEKLFHLKMPVQLLGFFILIFLPFPLLMFLVLKFSFNVEPILRTEIVAGAVYGFPLSIAFSLYMKISFISIKQDRVLISRFFGLKKILIKKGEMISFEVKRRRIFSQLVINTSKSKHLIPLLLKNAELTSLEEYLKPFLTQIHL
jgi:hypothetical protein